MQNYILCPQKLKTQGTNEIADLHRGGKALDKKGLKRLR